MATRTEIPEYVTPQGFTVNCKPKDTGGDRTFAKKLAKLNGMLAECFALSDEILNTDQAQRIEQIAEDSKRFTILQNMYQAYLRHKVCDGDSQGDKITEITRIIKQLDK